jgi:hypothetical protein
VEKKIGITIIIILLIIVNLIGCTDEEDKKDQGQIYNYENLIGTWTADAGSFTAGDSIRFNNDGTCDFFWSHSSDVLFKGTWVIKNLLADNQTLIITIGEQTYNYNYSFGDGSNTLVLKLEDASSGILYYRQ